ncbi:MAG: DUF488 family protein [Cyanophyceae cyanobacterium]
MSVPDVKHIYTFGYGNRRDYESLAFYLERYDIALIVDVRLRPRAWSRLWYGDSIMKFCRSYSTRYVSVPALGNTSGKSNWIPPDAVRADAALDKVAAISRKRNVLLLCAELKSSRCHRVAVAERVSKLVGISVMNLT